MISAIAFLLFAVVCSVLAFVRHPIWGLYFYFSSIYVHPPSRWWGQQLPDLRWALTSAAVTVAAVAFHRGRLSRRPVWLTTAPAAILVIYNLLMWAQTAWAADVDANLDGAAQFLKYLVGFWFVYRIADTAANVRNVLAGHAVGCGLLGLYAAMQGRQGDRLDGVGGPGIDDANTLGMYLATGVVVCMGLFLAVRHLWRWALIPLAGLIFTGFVLANSRGAAVGLLGGVLALTAACARMHRRQFAILLVVGLVGAAAVVDRAFIDRFFTIGDVTAESEEADMSARSRKVIIEAQLNMFADHPMGIGRMGTAKLSPLYLDEKWLTTAHTDGTFAERSSHNTFMSILVEQGVVGTVIYAALLIWLVAVFVQMRRLQRSEADREALTLAGTAWAAIVVVLASGLGTDYLMAEAQFWFYAALVSALQLARAAVPGVVVASGMSGAPRLRSAGL